MDELKERQQNELEVLQAIYLDAVSDLRHGGGFKWEPMAFALRLEPQRGSSHPSREQVETTIRLTLKLPRSYPEVIPEITIDEVKGLTNLEVSELKAGLNKLAKGSIGEVMALNLAQFAENFLFSHQKLPTGSFYDEMLTRRRIQEEKIIEKEQIFQEQERLAILEEIQKKQEALREEERLIREHRRAQGDGTALPSSNQKQSSPVKEHAFPPLSLDSVNLVNASKKRGSAHRRRRSVRRNSEESDSSISESAELSNFEISCHKELHSFQLGEILGQSSTGRSTHAGMDCKSGSLVAVAVWNFSVCSEKKNRAKTEITAKKENLDDIVKCIHSFESEFRVLQRLSHPNIIEYLGLSTEVSTDRETVILRSVEQFVRGNTLRSFLQDSITLEFSLVRHCAIGVLQGLEYLHTNNVVHRFMRDTSIFLDESGTIRICDYGLERKLCDLYRTVNADVQLCDKFSPSIGRGAKKCDIYRVGVIILSLLTGRIVSENPPQIPSSLPVELQDFLRKFLTTDEQARWTASQLLEHLFLKLPIEKRKFDALVGKAENPPDELEEAETQGFMSQVVKGHSRLQSEFEVLLWLGKGGFGDVVKVRNKLDGGVYALKRIRLNPRNKLLNKKITREVKLLSRLNHENVVRYFNSWIETVVEADEESGSTDTQTPTQDLSKKSPVVRFKEISKHNSLGIHDNIEELAPPAKEEDWSASLGGARNPEDDESDESSEEGDLFGTSFLCLDEHSDDIIFESESDTRSSPEKTTIKDGTTGDSALIQQFPQENSPQILLVREAKFMYIQMEFCERSTLRTAIDAGLFEDFQRTWRLFREIVEGLVHIHQQGMIHRDLKPVNIFLDSNDNVKIGDFGLATSNILPKTPGGGDGPLVSSRPDSVRSDNRQSADFGEDSLTGQVGTALYVAPELIRTGTRSTYNQKVDIYSLGIIFFEMFYHPPATSMERVRVIHGLRQDKIAFPPDFDETLFPRQTAIARWLLNHDPSQRPTSVELLQSDHLPPLEMEEAALQEVFRHTLSNPQSKAYKYLIHSCFGQNVSAAEEITYDMDVRITRAEGFGKYLAFRQRVKQIITMVFERHGALDLATPLLLPKSKIYSGVETSVQVMTHGGSVVTLPHDIRIPFARYVVANSLTNMKRYAIEKVFRERKVHGFHPRELYECAFDIISSSKVGQLADGEVIAAVFEIANELPWLREKNCTVRLGHTFLLEGIFAHFGIEKKFHAEIKTILADVKTEKHSKSQVQTRLISMCLPEQFISHLFALMEIEGPLSKLSAFLKGILRRKGEAASLVKEGLHDLELLETQLDAFGLKNNVLFSPSMVFGTRLYTGLTFQVMCQMKRRKNRLALDVIAAGGRYDALLGTLSSALFMAGTSKGTKQYGVGVSISLDKLISGLELEEIENWPGASRTVEVVICSFGNLTRESQEKISMMKDFWSHGISCSCLNGPEFQSIEAAEEHCRELGAAFLIVLKDSDILGALRVRIFERDRIHERKMTKAELIDMIKKSWKTALEGNEICATASSCALNLKTVESHKGSFSSESGGYIPSHQSSGNIPSVNITFVFPENKEKNSTWKRRHENLMMSHISETLSKLSKQQTVELIGIETNCTLIKTLGSYLQFHDKDQYNQSVAEVLKRHPRQKYVKAVCDEIFDLAFDKTSPIIIIFGLLDNTYKALL